MNLDKMLSKRIGGYRPLLSVTVGFIAINSIIYILVSLWPSLVDLLCLSSTTPWGIVTSIILHADLNHLLNNLRVFLVVAILLWGVLYVYPPQTRRKWCTAFMLIVAASGVGANVVKYLLLTIGRGLRSWGASGIVYGGMGVLLAVAVSSLDRQIARIKRKRLIARKKHALGDITEKCLSLTSILVVAVMLSGIFFDAGGFFGTSAGVDVFSHEMGFLIGFLCTTILGLAKTQ